MKFSFGSGNRELRQKLQDKKDAKRKAPGVTKRAKGGRGARFGLGLFCLIFLGAGSAFGWFMFAKPGLQLLDAQDWPSVPATVTASDLESNTDSDGTTYRINISFAYDYQGRGYVSDTYDSFSFISSGGYRGKQQIINDHPVGKQTAAFVNPKDPSVAVLHRGWSHTLWFGAIPLVFVLIGGGGLIGMFWSGSRGAWKTKSATRSDRVGPRDDDDWLPKFARASEQVGGVEGTARSEADVVSPTSSRWGKLGFLVVFTLIWNGVTFLGVWNIYGLGSGGNPGDWFAKLFMIPFVLVGVGLWFGLIYTVLALSNPIVRMRFDPRVMPWGAPLRVDWIIDGRAERIQRLIVTVEGLERASYTRGTDTITDEHVFFEHTLYDAEAMDRRDPMARDGEAELQLPSDAMHSLDATHNKIVWRIKVKGEIPKWPDIKDEYEFAVVPEALGPNSRGMF
ncbi:MAG: DUF3592 domain-containing protein [Planctomycetota bacterium]